jgi:hypothetical protein
MKFCFNKQLAALSVVALLAISSVANAGLIKGTGIYDGLIYDNQSNVTWISDLKYSGGNGKMKWQDGMDWADALSGPDGFGFSDWRLPTLTEAQDLQLSSTNLNLFENENSSTKIWTSTVTLNDAERFYSVKFLTGEEQIYHTRNQFFIAAVINGDIAGIATEVPEPASLAIFSLALAGLAYRRRTAKMPK